MQQEEEIGLFTLSVMWAAWAEEEYWMDYLLNDEYSTY